MRYVSFARSATVWAASLGLVFPPQAIMAANGGSVDQQQVPVKRQASTTTQNRIQIRDVELGQQGQFLGQLVDGQGQPVAGVAISLQSQNKQIQTTSNAQGQFQFADVPGGIYRLQTDKSFQLCRLWQNGTAPPKANRNMLFVQQDGQLALGQSCGSPVCGSGVGAGGGSGVKGFLTHPLVIGGLVAAAIAIPVAIHNSDDDPSASGN